MKLNTNEKCYVRLTPVGYEHFYKKQRELGIKDDELRQPKMVANTNWCEFHIWELMAQFGSMIYLGSQRIPFVNNEIIFGEEPRG